MNFFHFNVFIQSWDVELNAKDFSLNIILDQNDLFLNRSYTRTKY